MVEMDEKEAGTNVDLNIDRLDQALDIMERHAGEMAETEDAINESMRRWDREYKNDRFHSVPKPRKHIR
jgi:hypothetical protein